MLVSKLECNGLEENIAVGQRASGEEEGGAKKVFVRPAVVFGNCMGESRLSRSSRSMQPKQSTSIGFHPFVNFLQYIIACSWQTSPATRMFARVGIKSCSTRRLQLSKRFVLILQLERRSVLR